jgi:hypothetical protein
MFLQRKFDVTRAAAWWRSAFLDQGLGIIRKYFASK